MPTFLATWLANLLGGPIVTGLLEGYKAKLAADNTGERIKADIAIQQIALDQRRSELATQIVAAEEGRWYTALPRPLFALAFIIYVWKVVVWDKVLGLGVTDPLGGDIQTWAGWVLAAYFGGRTLEKTARIIKRG